MLLPTRRSKQRGSQKKSGQEWESIFEFNIALPSIICYGLVGEAFIFGYESFSDLPGEYGRILVFFYC